MTYGTSIIWQRAGIALLLLPGVGLIILFVGTVLGTAVAQSFGYFNFAGESEFSLSFWERQLASPLLRSSILYSLKIALVSATVSVALAYPIALWLRKPFAGSLLLSALLKAPMMVPGLVAAFLFINVIAFHGFLNEVLLGLGFIQNPFRMQNDRYGAGVMFLQVWKNMPFALLLLSGAVQSIHSDLLDAARDLGAGAWSRFHKIVLPLTLKAMQAALIIIFIGAAGDYSFQVVAGPTNVSSLAQHMYTVQHEFGQWNEAAVVAIILMVAALSGSLLLATFAQITIKRRRP
ncbi:ABC transporter permease [Phyllobacterium sp. P30BS-XVII]|uniref:ABC transporter permease n=1 Tax=Phyllobacterium sp. P30BS-XVII TaxID=2587046 RepID=UPI000DD65342|nr:ABC transporter permease [Phyllobacterium sp. P30BS-XVII]MBA8903862.1 putative spermidine/putrescine transport system permease protein [Phyllobacterium sp. P30BS-XVII]